MRTIYYILTTLILIIGFTVLSQAGPETDELRGGFMLTDHHKMPNKINKYNEICFNSNNLHLYCKQECDKTNTDWNGVVMFFALKNTMRCACVGRTN